MSDLHEQLERLAGRVDDRPAPDLHSARERHQRRRARSAMAVGLVVAVAAGALVVSALPSSDGRAPSSPGPTVADHAIPDPITIWPESPVTNETAEEAQERVDGGEDAWRLDAQEVVARFAQNVLGWTEPGLTPTTGVPTSYEVLPEVCPANARCIQGITVSVVQPATSGDGGIWSIAAVSQPELVIDVPASAPDAPLPGRTDLSFDVTVPADRTAHVGFVANNGCSGIGAGGISLESGAPTLRIPAASADDPDCSDVGAGYVFVYAMDDTTEPSGGDPITQPAAIEYPYLTVVPVYLQMEEGEQAAATSSPEPVDGADVVAVSCYGDPDTQLDTTVVAAQADGVHVLVRSTNAYVEVYVDDDFIRIEDSPRELVLDLPPGEHGVQCIAPGADQIWDPTPFEVVDPNGFWLDPSVACAPPDEIVEPDADVITVEGDPRDELLAAGEAILTDAIGESGEVTIAGYPESTPNRTVAMLGEDGSVLGRANFHVSEQGWFIDSYVTCDGTTIT